MDQLSIWVIIVLAGAAVLAEGSSNSSEQCLTEQGDVKEGCAAILVPWKSTFMFACPGEDDNYTMEDCSHKTYPMCNLPECSDDAFKKDLDNVERGSFAVHAIHECRSSLCVSHPDYCRNVECRPPPYNRTECKELNQHKCCSDYVCGNYRRRHENDPTCDGRLYCSPEALIYMDSINSKLNPDGSPCVVFLDEYNCDAPVHMCKSDEKPGRCPTINEIDQDIGLLRSCVGDYTCPSEQKCCKYYISAMSGSCLDPVSD